MSRRVFLHIAFWFAFISLYVIISLLFVASSDEQYGIPVRALRYYLRELAFLPWKIIPFYVLFYFLKPRYFQKGSYWKLILYFLLTLTVCLLAYRACIKPVQFLMYGDMPDFNAFSFKRILFSLTDVLPAVALASAFKLLNDNIIARRRQKELESEKIEAELNFLKAQTNPHFLFNTLNNLYGLARKNDTHTAPSILKLANIMRYILYECREDFNPLKSEVDIIEDYIALEKLRYDHRLSVTFVKSVDNWDYRIAPLILLPFVENAFKHGASENRSETIIDIRLELVKDKLSFSIGNSREDGEKEDGEGVGLKNVKRQLELIYGNNYKLDISSESHSFYVNLSIDATDNER